jgi:uncharacterized membrane protein HdeD (DUF308 family)
MAGFVIHPRLAQRWWMLLVRGILAILFGTIAFAWPGITVLFLTTLFALFAIIDGVIAMSVGLHTRWTGLTVLGGVGVLIGILALAFPGATAFTLLFIIAGWAIVRGAAEIAAAVQLRKVIPNEWALIFGGTLSVLFGVLLFANPAAGALSVIWIIGTYAILIGLLLIYAAFRVKTHPWEGLSVL